MDVLVFLIRNGTRVASREGILMGVWGPETFVNDEALTLAMSRLRSALGDDAKNPTFIETIPKRGYRLVVRPAAIGTDGRTASPSTDGQSMGTTAEQVRSPAERTRRVFRASGLRVAGVAVLVLLLLIVTALFIAVRIEYAALG
jgi:DNA-binding winged helix-turn-helix (wHTH) protein